eukprot:gene10780-3398_t
MEDIGLFGRIVMYILGVIVSIIGVIMWIVFIIFILCGIYYFSCVHKEQHTTYIPSDSPRTSYYDPPKTEQHMEYKVYHDPYYTLGGMSQPGTVTTYRTTYYT